jgi:hypothetical protein
MNNEQREMEADGVSLMRHTILGRWDARFGAGGYRINKVPQHSRIWLLATVGAEDGNHFAPITIAAQKAQFFSFAQGTSVPDVLAAGTNYTADAADTSLTKPGQLDSDEEMVIEAVELHGGLFKPVWSTMPYGMTAGDIVSDPYGTLVAVELGSGRALQDVLANAFLSQARLSWQYSGGKTGFQHLGPGILGAGGMPHNAGPNRPRFDIPEGLFWGSEQDPTGNTSAPESKLTIVAESFTPIKLLGAFGATARKPTSIAFSVTCVARGLAFAPTGRTN